MIQFFQKLFAAIANLFKKPEVPYTPPEIVIKPSTPVVEPAPAVGIPEDNLVPHGDIWRHKSLTSGLVATFEKQYKELVPDVRHVDDIKYAAKKCRDNMDRYSFLQHKLNVPWQVVAVIHQKEASGDFSTQLANGDSLKARTVHVPKGLPREEPAGANGAYTWEQGALSALQYEADQRGVDLTRFQWDCANSLWFLLCYNGWGYNNRGMNSPYLFSYSNLYQKGLYVADGKFDPEAVAKNPGAAVILRELKYLL